MKRWWAATEGIRFIFLVLGAVALWAVALIVILR